MSLTSLVRLSTFTVRRISSTSPFPLTLTLFFPPPSAYSFLDPNTEHAKLAAYIVGIGVAEAVIFLIVRYLAMLRGYLVRRTASTRLDAIPQSPDMDEKASPKVDERLSEWEEVGSPSVTTGQRAVVV